jgi:predicted permease
MKLVDILTTATNAVTPVILLILLGYFLMQKQFLNKEFVKIGNKLVFKVCLPVMLFVNVYNIESFASIQWDIVIYCVAALLVIFGVGLVLAPMASNVPERKGVILQCVFRSNFALIGLSLVSTMAGDSAVAVAAIISSFTIPVFNILAVIALSMYLDNGTDWRQSIKNVILNIFKNPLIIGIALGMVALVIRELQVAVLGRVAFSLKGNVKFLYTALNNIKSIASPFALLVLGAEFEFSSVKGLLKEIAVGTAARLVVAPVIGIGGVILLTNLGILNCGPDVYPGLVALFGSPVAVSSAIMAGSMGNDKQLATQLVVWTSLLSIVTIFVLVCVLMGMGLIVV